MAMGPDFCDWYGTVGSRSYVWVLESRAYVSRRLPVYGRTLYCSHAWHASCRCTELGIIKIICFEMETWFHTFAEFVNMQNPGRTDTSCVCCTFRTPVSTSAVLSGVLGVCSDVMLMWQGRLCAKDYRYYSSWKSHSVQYTCVPRVFGLFLMLRTLLVQF